MPLTRHLKGMLRITANMAFAGNQSHSCDWLPYLCAEAAVEYLISFHIRV
jgi:hypothetical protein